MSESDPVYFSHRVIELHFRRSFYFYFVTEFASQFPSIHRTMYYANSRFSNFSGMIIHSSSYHFVVKRDIQIKFIYFVRAFVMGRNKSFKVCQWIIVQSLLSAEPHHHILLSIGNREWRSSPTKHRWAPKKYPISSIIRTHSLYVSFWKSYKFVWTRSTTLSKCITH